MRKGYRNLLFVAAIALITSVLSFVPQPSASAEETCPYMHFACPPEEYDCCCPKGVRCDLTPGQCDMWCAGQLPF
jgi:hypothetical protein